MTEALLTPAQIERLAMVSEESGEVGQASAKIIRHGFQSRNPADPKSLTNREHLAKELGQQRLTARLLVAAGDVSETDIQLAMRQKAQAMPEWLHCQENKDLVGPAAAGAVTLDKSLVDRNIEMQAEVARRGVQIGQANELVADLRGRLKAAEASASHLSTYNAQLLADFNRQAGYIDRVLEQEAPYETTAAPDDSRPSQVLVAKGPRVTGLHGHDISHSSYERLR